MNAVLVELVRALPGESPAHDEGLARSLRKITGTTCLNRVLVCADKRWVGVPPGNLTQDQWNDRIRKFGGQAGKYVALLLSSSQCLGVAWGETVAATVIGIADAYPSPPRGAAPLKEFDLRLMSPVNDARAMPAAGKNLVIVADVQDVLHVRIFDAAGKKVVDTDKNRLTDQAPAIAELKSLLSDLWSAPQLSRRDKDRVVTAVTSIVGPAPLECFAITGEMPGEHSRESPFCASLGSVDLSASVLAQALAKSINGNDDEARTLRGIPAFIPTTVPLAELSTIAKLLDGFENYRQIFGKFDLRLTSPANDVGDMLTEGKNLVIVADVGNVLHFRIFDADGKRVVDTREDLLPDKAPILADLKSLLRDLWGVPRLSRSDKARAITAVTSIVGHNRCKDRVDTILTSVGNFDQPNKYWTRELKRGTPRSATRS